MLPLAAALAEAAARGEAVLRCAAISTVATPARSAPTRDRDRSVICVVERVGDLWALERVGVHQGLYHVLGGTLSALGGIGPEDLNVAPLLARVAAGPIVPK